jgi:3-hydroxyisobutyrate dehydrogenase-like beta-hydroxyacid dehydrogenase
LKDGVIGFIGFGEAASIFAADIRMKSENTKIFAYDSFISQRGRDLAEKSKTTLVDSLDELTNKSDLIVSLVTGSAAISVAEQVSDFLSKEHLFVDFNSVSPQVKQAVASVLESKGLKAVDASVMGSVPDLRIKAPILLAGEYSELADEKLKMIGFSTSVVSKKVGDASAIKMVRSVFAKGLEGLFVEMLLAGKKYGVMEYVIDSISKSLEGKKIRDVMNTLVVSQAYHSERKKSEMDFVIDVLNQVDVKPLMSTATRDTFKWLSELKMKTDINPDTATYLDILNVIEAKQNSK